MFSTEIKKVKSECWWSPFRCVGRDAGGRAKYFVMLTQSEMMQAATTGHVSIPDSQMPKAVLAQRDLEGSLHA